MRQYLLKPLTAAFCALALYAISASSLPAQDRPEDHHDQNAQEHRDAPRADHPDAGRADPVAQYRHDHPHSSARCHDGFFTRTSDRSRACSKHGGIDVWLSM